jgi:UDPglucose 6-dehydrogenase
MRVTMVGTGYVGLVSGACFSEFGHDVICIDREENKIERLSNGEIPIYEPGLEELVERNVHYKRLSFSTDLGAAVHGSDAVFIAVGTPTRRGDGHADLQYVYGAAEEVAQALNGYTVVVTKSTVPVGTGREVKRIIKTVRPDADFDIASNPEFLREGSAIEDFLRPNRVVCGVETERAKATMRELYRPLFLSETPVMFTTLETSELIKYAANAFLATKVTFINEMADLCEQVGADVQMVARGMGLDQRIGSKFLHAGPGFGGSCFPKDTLALLRIAEAANSDVSIVRSVVEKNDQRKQRMHERVVAACGGSVAGKTVAILGLTFKPNTDDMRESPAIDIVNGLVEGGASVRAYDPQGMKEAARIMPDITYCSDAYSAMQGADAFVIVTEWNAFRALDLKRAGSLLKHRIMVDLRNIYDPNEVAAAGFAYYSIGRPMVPARKIEGMVH